MGGIGGLSFGEEILGIGSGQFLVYSSLANLPWTFVLPADAAVFLKSYQGTHPAPSGARRDSFSGMDYKVRWDFRTQGVFWQWDIRVGGLSGERAFRR